MRRLRRRIVSFALIAGTVVAPAGLASAGGASAAGWLPAQNLPTAPGDIAVDGHGNAVAVGTSGGTVQATVRPFGGAWSAPTTFDPAGDTAPTQPKITVDAEGSAVAVWSATNDGDRVIRIAHRPAGGTWSEALPLTDETNWSTDYALATDGQGITTVIWSEFTGGPAGVFVLKGVSRPTGGSWATAASTTFDVPASPEGSATHPAIGAGEDGTVTVAWVAPNPDPEGLNLIWASSRNATGSWSAVNDISDGGIVNPPQVVVDLDGDSTVVWNRGGIESTIRGAYRPAGGNWSLEGALGVGREPDITVAPDGTATVAWLDAITAGSAIRTSTKPDGGAWSAPAELATSIFSNALRYPQVATDGEGAVTAIWGRFTDPTTAIAEVARRNNGVWRNEQTSLSIGSLSDYPVGAIDRKGHVTLAWKTSTAFPGASSIFDPVSPELRDLAVPTVGVVGEPVSVSVSPFDLTAVTTTWDFGGASASGATASHTYAAPGTYTVTVKGTDAAGNETQASRTITIVPPAVKGFPKPPDADADPKPNPVPTVKAPVLSALQQTSVRWTTAKRRGSRVPVGTSFRFRLDRAAKVRLSFAQLVAGRRSGKSCVKATKANRRKRSCDRVEPRGAIEAFGKAGANGVEFRGKVGRRTLKPGRYRVQVTATADGKTSKAATKTFTIVR